MDKKKAFALYGALIAVCFCMRSPMGPVGPLVSQIKESLSLNAGFAGLLTTIPLLFFALACPFAFKLMNRINDKVLIPLCLVLSFAGLLWRSYGGVTGLLGGTALIGVGIGVLNVAVPVFIRMNFKERIGVAMGVYTMSMNLLSALSAGFCIQLAKALGAWNHALAVFAFFPVAALPLWLYASRVGFENRAPAQVVSLARTAKQAKNWFIGIFMALQSILFFCLIAWLPSALGERGAAREDTGLLILLMQLVSLSTNFLMPVLMQRYPRKKPLLALLSSTVYALGFVIFLFASPSAGMFLCSIVLMGLGSGFSISYALTMITMQGKTREETAGVSSFAQGIGYLLSAPAPVLLGMIVDGTGSFLLPMRLLLFVCLPMALVGMAAGKETGVKQEERKAKE